MEFNYTIFNYILESFELFRSKNKRLKVLQNIMKYLELS